MSVVACGVLVWVATRPDTPRPIKGYYEAARAWDADEAVEDASRQLGWTVRYELPADVPHFAGMPRPVDVRVADRDGKPVSGLAGRLFAIRPSDTRLNQSGDLAELPQEAGQLPDPRAPRRARRVGAAHRREAGGAPVRPCGQADGPGRAARPGRGEPGDASLPGPPRERSRGLRALRPRGAGEPRARGGRRTSSAATAAGRSTRSSTSGDSISTTGSSSSSMARSSPRASPGGASRTSTTSASRPKRPSRSPASAAARGSTSKASTAPPASGSSRSSRRCCAASTRSA